jgi:TRAP-type C4-dicarboxylate transport system substrate-binding protein
MNKKKWDSLGPDLQKIFKDVFAPFQAKSAVGWNEINVLGFKTAIAQGAEFITLSTEEAARWKAAVQPVIDNYVTKMVGKGFTEAQAKEQIAFIKDRMAYWDQKAIEQNIPGEGNIK